LTLKNIEGTDNCTRK